MIWWWKRKLWLQKSASMMHSFLALKSIINFLMIRKNHQIMQKWAKNAISCIKHIQQQEVPLGCSDYVTLPMGLSLPYDSLPTNRQVLAYYFTISPVHAGFSNSENGCLNGMLHWISCNIYTYNQSSACRFFKFWEWMPRCYAALDLCSVYIQWQEKVYKQNLMEQSKIIGILRRSPKQNKVKPFIQDKITTDVELTIQHQISWWTSTAAVDPRHLKVEVAD